MDKPFKRAVKRAGLDPSKITPHVMRHTAITNLVQAGVDLPTIQVISGHTVFKMLEMLEELDDVQAVFSNADIPESVLENSS